MYKKFPTADEKQHRFSLLTEIVTDDARRALERGGPSPRQLQECRAETPPTDRGVTLTTGDLAPTAQVLGFSIDSVSLTAHGIRPARVREILADLLYGLNSFSSEDEIESVFEARLHGARGFAALWIERGTGVRVYGEPRHGDFVHVELLGESCARLGEVGLVELVAALTRESSRLKIVRIDPAWDHCRFTPRTMFRAARSGKLRVASKRGPGWLRWIESDPGVRGERDADDERALSGRSVYIGMRKSSRMLRCYDARGFTRCELELKHERAHALGMSLFGAPPADWSMIALGHLLDFVSFCDTAADSNLTRASRDCMLGWWSKFVGSAEAAGVRFRRKKAALVATFNKRVDEAVQTFRLLSQLVGRRRFGRLVRSAIDLVDESIDRRATALRAAVSPPVHDEAAWDAPWRESLFPARFAMLSG